MALDFNAAPRDDHLNSPKGVAVTPDSSFVIVCDSQNDRVQMLRLVVDGNTAYLEFVRSIGSSPPNSSDQSKLREGYLVRPTFVALLPGAAGGQQTMLITDTSNKGVSQFELDGTFIRIFAGKKDDEKDGGGGGSGSRPSSGQLDFPKGITVLASSGEVAIISGGCTVQIFDRERNYKRQFGSYGTEDGQFSTIDQGGLTSDACGNILIVDYGAHRLQVFNAQGTHLCTRSDFGIGMDDYNQVTKAIAWSTGGRLALATCGVETGIWERITLALCVSTSVCGTKLRV
jgi:DNA-binding beta-propeller fold protein YncE